MPVDRPSLTPGTTRPRKQTRLKQEPSSPVMSGYGVRLHSSPCRLKNGYSLTHSMHQTKAVIPITRPIKQECHNILKPKSINTMHNISATRRNHTTSSKTTTPIQLRPLTLHMLPPWTLLAMTIVSGTALPTHSMCLVPRSPQGMFLPGVLIPEIAVYNISVLSIRQIESSSHHWNKSNK